MHTITFPFRSMDAHTAYDTHRVFMRSESSADGHRVQKTARRDSGATSDNQLQWAGCWDEDEYETEKDEAALGCENTSSVCGRL